VETQRAATRGTHDGQSITFQPTDSAARQLVQLSLHYLVNQPRRICVLNQDIPLPDADAITASPRMIAFVDVPPGTRFPPQAADLDGGRVVTFFSPLIEKLQRDGGTLPVAYPGSTATDAGRCQRDAYWNWFADHWNAVVPLEKIIRQAIQRGRPPAPMKSSTTLTALSACPRIPRAGKPGRFAGPRPGWWRMSLLPASWVRARHTGTFSSSGRLWAAAGCRHGRAWT
jgi:hypothetical protein